MSVALSLIDRLIAEVAALPRVPVRVSAKSSSSSSDSTTTIRTTTSDVAWEPITAIGHTEYSWVGEGDVDPFAAPTPFGKGKSEQGESKKANKAAKPAADAKGKGETGGKAAKGGKEKEKKSGAAEVAVDPSTPDIARIDIRVGKIIKAWKHPDADSLYCELIDIGEEQPRQVCSGLVNYIPHDKFEGSDVLCIVNLKPGNLRGIMSYGMVLAAKSEDGTKVELVKAPKGSIIGERLSLRGDDILKWTPELSVDAKKKNSAWAICAPEFKTNEKGEACYKGVAFVTSKGACTASLKNSVVA